MKNFSLSFFALLAAFGVSVALAAWTGPTLPPPEGNTPPPLNTSAIGQSKIGGLLLGTSADILNGLLVANGRVGIGTTSPASNLKLSVKGNVGASAYCDENGGNCVLASGLGGTGTSPVPMPLAPGSSDPLAGIKEKYGLQNWPSYIDCRGNVLRLARLGTSAQFLDPSFRFGTMEDMVIYAPQDGFALERTKQQEAVGNYPPAPYFAYLKRTGASANWQAYSERNSPGPQYQCPTPLSLDGRIA
jgi:hypothetical protein